MSRGESMPSPPNPLAHTALPVAPPGSAASGGKGVVSTGFFTCGGGGVASFFSSFFSDLLHANSAALSTIVQPKRISKRCHEAAEVAVEVPRKSTEPFAAPVVAAYDARVLRLLLIALVACSSKSPALPPEKPIDDTAVRIRVRSEERRVGQDVLG